MTLLQTVCVQSWMENEPIGPGRKPKLGAIDFRSHLARLLLWQHRNNRLEGLL